MNNVRDSARNAGLIWLTLCVLVAGGNAFSAFISAALREGNQPYALGAALGAVIFPAVVVLLFQIGERFRNNRSRAKIFFFTSLLSLIGNLSTAGRIASERAASGI